MKQKGFTLIELLVVIAILAVIAAIVTLNVYDFFGRGTTNNETATNETLFWQLASEPISSLNLTELNFMVDYCMARANKGGGVSNSDDGTSWNTKSSSWIARVEVYQNQIIINELKEQL